MERRPDYPELAWQEKTGEPTIPDWLIEQYAHFRDLALEEYSSRPEVPLEEQLQQLLTKGVNTHD